MVGAWPTLALEYFMIRICHYRSRVSVIADTLPFGTAMYGDVQG
jgi:hypothetical protein